MYFYRGVAAHGLVGVCVLLAYKIAAWEREDYFREWAARMPPWVVILLLTLAVLVITPLGRQLCEKFTDAVVSAVGNGLAWSSYHIVNSCVLFLGILLGRWSSLRFKSVGYEDPWAWWSLFIAGPCLYWVLYRVLKNETADAASWPVKLLLIIFLSGVSWLVASMISADCIAVAWRPLFYWMKHKVLWYNK